MKIEKAHTYENATIFFVTKIREKWLKKCGKNYEFPLWLSKGI